METAEYYDLTLAAQDKASCPEACPWVAERHDGWANDSPGKMSCIVHGKTRAMTRAEMEDRRMRQAAYSARVRASEASLKAQVHLRLDEFA